MKKELKKGQKIKFVGMACMDGRMVINAMMPAYAIVDLVNGPNSLRVSIGDKEAYIHPRQVTHRVVPKKRNEIWLRDYPDAQQDFEEGKPVKAEIANRYARSGSHWRRFREVKE